MRMKTLGKTYTENFHGFIEAWIKSSAKLIARGWNGVDFVEIEHKLIPL